MGVSQTTRKAMLDGQFPTTGAGDYIAYSTNGTSEAAVIARTAVGATGWAAATSADPSVKANGAALTTAAASGAGTITPANMDLTGSTVRLLARKRFTTTGDPTVLDCAVTDAAGGIVTHTLTGLLDVGSYNVELEVTRTGEVVTFPTGDGPAAYETLTVVEDLG